MLQQKFAAAKPTDAEFRSILQLQQASIEQLHSLTPAQAKQGREAIQQQLQTQLKAVLGEARYADYANANDADYQQVGRLVAQLNMPPATTPQVLSVQQDIEQRARAVRANPSLAPAVRAQQLSSIAHEATARISSLLGSSGFNAYKQNVGTWLRKL